MKFHLSRGTGKPLQEQLAAQLLLGILSGELKAGQRLPSLRQLARMLKLHPNSIALVYANLTERGWLQTRPGSGVYVAANPQLDLDHFIQSWLEAGAALGFTREQITAALNASPQPSVPIVLDPDPEFARIIAAELSQARSISFDSAGLTEHAKLVSDGRQVWCNPGHATQVSAFLEGRPVKQIALRSIHQMLDGITRPAGPALIGIVSRSSSIRLWASSLLPALGVPIEASLIRDPATPGWQSGLDSCSILGADIVAAGDLPPSLHAHPIRIVAI